MFSQSVLIVPDSSPGPFWQIPVASKRPGRIGLTVQISFDSPSATSDGFSSNPFWDLKRVWSGDLLDQEFWLGFSTLVSPNQNGDYWANLCVSQTQTTFNPDIVWDGIAPLLGFTAFIADNCFPWRVVVWESWPDPPEMEGPVCDDGTPATVDLDWMQNTLKVRECCAQRPLPIVSLDLMVKRLKGRGLINARTLQN